VFASKCQGVCHAGMAALGDLGDPGWGDPGFGIELVLLSCFCVLVFCLGSFLS